MLIESAADFTRTFTVRIDDELYYAITALSQTKQKSRSVIARALLGSVGMSQANERMWRMPGHLEAMKGAVSCDKRGGAAHTH